MKKYNRSSAVLLVLLMLAGLMAGCTGKEQSVEVDKENVTLWHYWSHGHTRRELISLVDSFNASQDEIEVTIQYVPDEDFKKRLAYSMADGDMPALALVDSSDFQYFHAMEPFVDLTDEIEGIDEYLPRARAACTVNGRIMGLPYGMNCTVFFYNKEMLQKEQAEVPQTWEELYETAVKLSGEGHCGFAMPALPSEESVYAFLPLLWSMGGSVDAIDSPESREAFHYLRRLTQADAMSRQTINLTSGDLVRQFMEGNIAMMINSSTTIDAIQNSGTDIQYGVTSLPAGKDGTRVSVLGGEVFGVADGPHKEAAIEFLRYISDKKRMAEYMENSAYMAPRKEVLENQYADDGLKRSMKPLVKTASLREFSVEWPYISQIITDTMEEEIIGERDETELLKEAAEEVQAVREDSR